LKALRICNFPDAFTSRSASKMPIYAYKCDSCGHAKDVLQKMSDAPLVDCPVCGAPAFKKQLTAAGFQLKGSGWYVTDFRGGAQSGEPAKEGGADKAAKPGDTAAPASPAAATVNASAAPAVPAAAPAPASSPTPAAVKGH
jgi:putative FmdB family regulatory protein